MAWETDFIRLLDKPEADKPLVFALRRITFPDWGVAATILPNSGGIVDRSIRTVGYTLNTQGAAVQGGGFELDLTDQSWVTTMRKGDVFELLACFKEEGEVFEWNTIDIGVLEDIEVTGTTAHLVCSGFQSLARSRRTNVVGEQMLYFDMYDGVDDVEFIDFDPGSDTTIEVSDLGKFLRETADDGLVRIEKEGGGWYYAVYTGTSGGDTLTGVTADVLDTEGEAVTACRIHPVPFLYGHPIAIWEKSLTSTGTGLNGSRDDFPKSWGFALTDTYVDAIDMALWQAASADSFIYMWPDDGGSNDFRDFEIQGDWYAWFTGITRNLGFYPCLVEGAVSMRCLVQEEVVVETWGFEMEITDEDLIDGPDGISSHLWSPAHAAQFHRLVIFGATLDDTVDAELADFLPAARLAITAAPNVRGAVEPDVLADAVERMKPWYVGTEDVAVPQLLVLRGRSLKFSQLALGDKPLFSTERIRSVEGSAITDNRPTVVGVIPDWNAGTCVLMLAIFPTVEVPAEEIEVDPVVLMLLHFDDAESGILDYGDIGMDIAPGAGVVLDDENPYFGFQSADINSDTISILSFGGSGVHPDDWNPYLGVDTDTILDMWVYPTGTPGGGDMHVLYAAERTGNDYVRFGIDSSRNLVYEVVISTVTTVSIVGATPLTLDTWHHVIVNRHGGVTTIGLDGVWLGAAIDHTNYGTLVAGGTGGYGLGGRAISGSHWPGNIDEVRYKAGAYFDTDSGLYVVPTAAYS